MEMRPFICKWLSYLNLMEKITGEVEKLKKKNIYLFLILFSAVVIAFFFYHYNKKDGEKQSNTEKQLSSNYPSSKEILDDLKKNSPDKIHPRLMAKSTDFQNIKGSLNSDIYLKKWYGQLSKSAENLLSKPTVKYEKNDGKRLLPISRTVLNRTVVLSMMYRLSGNRKYAERAWTELKAAAYFPDWNPSHFLDTAEMANAVGIGYDWLYDYLSPEQKEILQRALIHKAFYPALEVYHHSKSISGVPWNTAFNNWNTIVNGGLITSALAIADESPLTEKVSGEVLKNAIKSVQHSLNFYSKDGGFAEGPDYWVYATKYVAFFLSSLDSSLGTDYGLSQSPGLSQTGYYYIYMNGPGGLFNLGDSSNRINDLSQLLWFSDKYHNEKFAYPALKLYNPMNIIWYKKTIKNNTDSSDLPLDKLFRRKDIGIVTMRSSWDDLGTMFIGVHAGSNKANHGDLDIGTFVLDALGERWAEDLGADNYNLTGYFDTKKKRWTYYRKSTEGQNTLVINPSTQPNQKVNASGKIEHFIFKSNKASVTVDLTNAYMDAESIERKISLVRNRKKAIVEDHIKLMKDSDIYWSMHTRANIFLSANKKSAVLTRDDKVLFAKIISPSEANFSHTDAKPLEISDEIKNQNNNQGIRKLMINLQHVKSTKIIVEFFIE